MDNNKNILDYWPFQYDPRPNQVTALEWLAKQEAKYLLLEAPTGSGKSNIAVTYSQYLTENLSRQRGNSFILTPQRVLQEQYERSFRDVPAVKMFSFYGKSNYTCKTKHTTCDIGQLVKPRCDYCPFSIAKETARKTPDTVLNYKLALTSFAYTNTFKPRELLVFDECHTLESHLVDLDALAITKWRCDKYKIRFHLHKRLDKALKWMSEIYLPQVREALSRLEQIVEPLVDKHGSELTRADINRLREYSGLSDHVDETTLMTRRTPEYLDEHFVLVWDSTKFQFKRLKGAYSFHKIVVPYAKRFLMMSSTILNKDGFCEDLGISAKDTAFLSLSSEFPEEKRPVVYMPQCRMNAKWKESANKRGRELMVTTIQLLLNNVHASDHGLIHTGNFEIAKWLVENLEGNIPQKIYHHNPEGGDDRNSVIEAFQQDPKPAVLISPSSTEGLDLKDDLGRFAIFCKVPFGYLGDQWIKRRMELSLRWYHRRALIDVIQGGGRVVRSDEDFGTVYILDASWAYLYKQAFNMIPKWWREAYTTL